MLTLLRQYRALAPRSLWPASAVFWTLIAYFATMLGAPAADANPFVRMDYNLFTSRARGTVFIELFDDRPLTRDNFLQYVNGGHYDESLMHRMVRNFVIQGGGFYPVTLTEPAPLFSSLDPTVEVDLDGNPATPNPTVNNEFGNLPFRSNLRGTLAMAKLGGNPNSATSEYFFNVKDNGGPPSELDSQNGGFTVFARVVGDGMSLIDLYNAQLNILNLNPDFDDNGTRDGTLFSSVPVLGSSAQNYVPLVLLNADQIDYLGAGLNTTIPVSGLTFSARDAFIDTGTTFTVPSGPGTLTVGAGRKLGIREGTVLQSRPLVNLGTLEPGLQLGSVTVASFRQDPGAKLEIQINGTTADTSYDRIVATGGALLGGDLNVTTLGYNPTIPTTASPSGTLYTFTILTAGLISGDFDNINLFDLSPGLVWNITKTNTAFTLTVNTGDFNRDGVVDTADYVLWRKTRGTTVATTFAGADADGNLQIYDADYLIWKKNFGNTAGGSGGGAGGLSSSPVPEPSAVALVLGGLACVAGLRRRHVAARQKTA